MEVLIIKMSSLGDILHTFPVINYLKETQEDVNIDWVVEEQNRSLIEAHPDIRTPLVVKTKAWRKGKHLKELPPFIKTLRSIKYDVVFDLQGNCKSGCFTAASKAHVKVGFGKERAKERPNCWTTHEQYDSPKWKTIQEDLLYPLQSHFKDWTVPQKRLFQFKTEEMELPQLKNGAVIVAPGSLWENKCLPIDTLAEFLKKWAKGPLYYSWGTDIEREKGSVLQRKIGGELLPKLPLPQLHRLMQQASVVVAMDSLPLYLAALANVPTFAFYGPSNGQKYAPGEYFQGKCPYNYEIEKQCPMMRKCPTGACLNSLKSEEILYSNYYNPLKGES